MIAYRDATIADVPALAALMRRAFDARYGEGWNSGQLLGTLALPGTFATLALDTPEVAGFTLLRLVADEAELLLIAVDPERRGGGIGLALLDRALATAATYGAVRIHLEVRADNRAAQALYAKRDFICVGSRKAYYIGQGGERFDAQTMSRQF